MNGGVEAGRAIALEGAFNFRDIGGYPAGDRQRVRCGLVFRSDALHHLTRADVAHLRERIGLGTVIDLRSDVEVAEAEGLLRSSGVRVHHYPLFPGRRGGERVEWQVPESLADLYVGMLERAGQRFAGVLELVAGTEAPLVFHCAAGKDRTGVVSALLLGLLGVEEEHIVADYVLTKPQLPRIVERLSRSRSYRHVEAELPPDTMHAEAGTMEALLAALRRRWRSFEGWAVAAGLPEGTPPRLRSRLLEEA